MSSTLTEDTSSRSENPSYMEDSLQRPLMIAHGERKYKSVKGDYRYSITGIASTTWKGNIYENSLSDLYLHLSP
jgi:hypothetical protein